MLHISLPFLLVYTICVFPLKADIRIFSPVTSYVSDREEADIAIINDGFNNAFHLKGWIEDENGNRDVPFTLKSQDSLLKAGQESRLQIRFTGVPHAPSQQKESLFWINIYSEVAVPTEALKDFARQTAKLQKTELIYRPTGLNVAQKRRAHENVRFIKEGGYLYAINPSPFYLTLSQLHIAKRGAILPEALPSLRLSPFSTSTLPAAEKEAMTVSWRQLSDFDRQTKKIIVQIEGSHQKNTPKN